MEQGGCREMEERMSIRDNSRKLKKYGSTSKQIIRNDNLIKYMVSKNDTLPGIALKFGISTEQIRRINRLWASDSLFLREHLLIPVLKNTPSTSFQQNNDHDECQVNNSSGSPLDNTSVDNFLAKMDSSIANVKKDIQKSQDNSAFLPEDDLFVQRRPGNRLRHSHPQSSSSPILQLNSSYKGPTKSSSEDDVHDLPSAVVMTQGRKLKSSLQKLQQQQDEIFQL